jgi:hypothetical protein
VTRGRLGDDALAALATLLLELGAWKQRVPVAPPVPDESRATLTVRCEGGATTVWERYNDLAAGRRLIRVRDHVLGICG